MESKIKIEQCNLEQLPHLLAFLDEEFVFSKGRTLSLAERFPQVFCPANLENIYVAQDRSSIYAAATVKLFDWLTPGKIWKGAMIGMVYTRPEYRGHGLASLVMHTIQNDLSRRGVDFAVLWTTKPNFYQRLGWFMEDIGILYEAVLPCSSQSSKEFIIPRSLTSEDAGWLDSLHSKWILPRVIRSELDYRVVPLPAHSVEVFRFNESDDLQGYSLVGEWGDTGYVYEFVGHPDTFDHLWSAICAHYHKIYVNDYQGSLSSKWLTATGKVLGKPQCLSMWFPFSQEAKSARIGKWYIPYWDRI